MEKREPIDEMQPRTTKFHYVYVLSCADGDLYAGYTVDPKRRLDLHNQGTASKFTRSRLPVAMVHLERFRSKSKALKREIEIKKMKRREKLALCSTPLRLAPAYSLKKTGI